MYDNFIPTANAQQEALIAIKLNKQTFVKEIGIVGFTKSTCLTEMQSSD